MQVSVTVVEIEAEDEGGHFVTVWVPTTEEARALACQYGRPFVIDLPGPQPASVYRATTEEG
jgi:hypothetical protein